MSNRRNRGSGSLYKPDRSPFWWMSYYDGNGRRIREGTRTKSRTEAQKILNQSLAAIHREGAVFTPARLRVNDLLDILVEDYEINQRKSLHHLKRRLVPIREAIGHILVKKVTESTLIQYRDQRLRGEDPHSMKKYAVKTPKAPATVNRELAALRRAFNLARKRKLIAIVPGFELLQENNVRKGFIEAEEYQAIRRDIHEDLREMVTFLYFTGWRKSEVLGLTWSQVDFVNGIVRLEVGTTKNSEGRSFPFSMLPGLEACLHRQRERTQALGREESKIAPRVFWHGRGKPIKDFRSAWDIATRKAGCPDKLVHDFRRTAVRNLERAGVSRSVAMKLVGHQTESVYLRYCITSEKDLQEGVGKLAQLHRDGTLSTPKKKGG